MLDREDHLSRRFIDGDSERAVRRMKHPCGLDVAFCLPIEDDQMIFGVIVHSEDVAGLRIDVDAAIQFQMRLRSTDDPLRLRECGVWWSVRRAVVDERAEHVLVLQDDFVALGVHGYSAEQRVTITNDS